MRLGLLSLLAHAGAAWAIAWGLGAAGAGIAASVGGAALFAFFPPAWSLGVQPEVFGWVHLCLALAIAQALAGPAAASGGGPRRALAVGTLAGASLAQSPLALVIAGPAFLVSAWRERRQWIAGVASFSAVAVLFYASLPWLRRSGTVWPDWGHLPGTWAGAGAIWNHLLRKEFGILSLTSDGGSALSGLQMLTAEALRSWNVALLLLLPAGLWLKGRRMAGVAVVGSLVAALAFLAQARTPQDDAYSRALLERFLGTAAVPLGFLFGFGLAELGARLPQLASPLAVIIPIGMILLGYAEADASRDRTMELFLQGVSQDLPADALYLAAQSEEYFSGIPPDGRFPIAHEGFFERPWYVREVMPALEPRLAGAEPHGLGELLELAERRGIPEIASVDEAVFSTQNRVAELRGLVLVAPAAERVTERTLRSAVALCPLVVQLESLPAKRKGYSRQLRQFFVRAFDGAADWLRRTRGAEAPETRAAERVMTSLLDSVDPAAWRSGCEELERASGPAAHSASSNESSLGSGRE